MEWNNVYIMEIKRTKPSMPVSTNGPWTPVDATGGVESIITVAGVTYKLHMFTTIGTDYLKINDNGSDGLVQYLVVAGGGGGGMDMGGGGGAGGLLSGRHKVSAGETLTCTVGAGGMGAPGGSQYRSDGTGPQPGSHQFTIPATNGGNSIFGPYTAIGGGFGGSSYRAYTPGIAGGAGGSGGGASGYNDNAGTFSGGTGTSGQGFRGGNSTTAYYSGGGGGAGGPGIDSTSQANGGPGVLNDILGYNLYWAGGGGGSAYSLANGGNGGIGGGGGGAVGTSSGGAGYNSGQGGLGGSPNSQTNVRGGSAGVNTGGGGGGGSHYNATNSGGEGGSGIVVVRYPISIQPKTYVDNGLILFLDASNYASYPTTGTTWYDISGNGYNGTLTNGPTYSTNNGGCLIFDGTNDYIKLTSTPLWQNIRNITYSLWFKTSISSTRQGLISTHENTGGPNQDSVEIEIQADNTSFVGFRSTNGTFYLAAYSSPISINTWYNLTAVLTGDSIVYYLNGSQVASASWPNTNVMNAPSGALLLANYGSLFLNGSIGNMMAYGRALTATEILQNFTAFRGRFLI